MCGIAGFWAESPVQGAEQLAQKMGVAILHRGPDSSSTWHDEAAGLSLVHRRLAILDLSPAGAQPMTSRCGRYILCYNGEIYNYRALRGNLEATGHGGWRGKSDTEVLLALIVRDGLHKALEQSVGMFAIALWDRKEKVLTLARDRIGEKPLYYGRQGGSLLFASELKALRVHPDWQGDIDRDAITLLMRHNYIGAPYCIYRGIKKLLPGHYVEVRENGWQVSDPISYWSLEGSVLRGQANPLTLSDTEATDQLEELLMDAIGQQMEADVPLGAFLSGGVDSSTVVALMQAQSSRPVKSFSIGFHEQGYDEAQHAKAVAAYLKTDHTELYISAKEAMNLIPRLPQIFDEPFSDSSQIPTHLVSVLARRHVTVSLSGDGGDELFCGYSRYTLGHDIWSKLRRLPGPLRQGLAALLPNLPGRSFDRAAGVLPKRLRLPGLGDKLSKLGEVLNHKSGEEFYRALVSHFKAPEALVLNSREPGTLLSNSTTWPVVGSLHERMMYLDTATYLPGDILTKVDRAAMAVSLETRVPLLDHRVVEFAHRVPMDMKLRNGQGKWLLRQVLHRHVPANLMDRPKMGFGVPIGDWLRDDLRDWAEALLDETRLKREGYFDAFQIRKMWHEHYSGRRHWPYHLWSVLMFQSWLDSA